ncbi:MutS protein msh4 [Boothiomyces sp. JEL0838]|nr:MutS protein msh4 [Boothiomyces sp. JEL0838]
MSETEPLIASQIRPSTSKSLSQYGTRPSTAISQTSNSNIIVVISEARGAYSEVGLVSIDLKTSICQITQYADTASFVHTIHKLSILNPAKVVFSKSCINPPTLLYQAITNQVEPNIYPAERNWFNQENGLETLKQYSIKEINFSINEKYFALSAISALFKYIENTQNLLFKNHSVKFNYESIDGTMFIDSTTAMLLELVANRFEKKKGCLLGLLNKTKTGMGARLLKSNIIQPLRDLETIKDRQEAIKEIFQSESLLYDLSRDLNQIPDLNKTITAMIQIPKKITTKFSEQSINRVLAIKFALEKTQILAESMSRVQSTLLVKIHKAKFEKTPIGLRNQRCFAVKSQLNQMLDVARQTYKEGTDDIHELIQHYFDTFELKIELKFNQEDGYFMSIADNQLKDSLPTVFINPQKRNSKVAFTSMQMVHLNMRIKESLREIYLMSEEHPVMEKELMFNPNDAFADSQSRLQIIGGSNMSGKSTYLNQIALTVIMAQICSYVPCEFATIRMTDKLLARIGHDDSYHAQISSFTNEMHETSFILDNFTDQSLAFVFFASHFDRVHKFLSISPNTLILHFQDPNTVDGYKIKGGECLGEHYGIDLAKKAGFEQKTCALAFDISQQLHSTWKELHDNNPEYLRLKALAKKQQVPFTNQVGPSVDSDTESFQAIRVEFEAESDPTPERLFRKINVMCDL